MFHQLCVKLDKAGKIGGGLTFHGLRHTVATKLADAGADDKTIAAITGHKSMSQIQRYTRTASQKRRGIASQPVGIVHILVAGETTIDRLAQQTNKTMPTIPTRPVVRQHGTCKSGEAKGIIKFPVSEKPSVGGDPNSEEFKL
jgi:hypothetical protein